MKKIITSVLCTIMLGMILISGVTLSSSPASAAGGAQLVEASIVTEVLDWGETVTALRLEYSDEIDCSAIEHSNEHPGKFTYNLVNDRSITNLYVNNTGKKDDVQLYGKYVFINLGIENQDFTTYRDQITFNTNVRTREKLMPFYLFQSDSIKTRNGKEIAPSRITTSKEICLGTDDFKSTEYKDEETGRSLYYHLYIPEGYELKNTSKEPLPLVVHYPSGDYYYSEHNGKYRGALFTHPDAVVWGSEEAQEQNPAFVVTIGGPRYENWSADYSESEMQQIYVKIINKIMSEYKIDSKKIYAISLAGGSVPMWKTILANPDLFAAQISTAYDPYHAFKDVKLGEEKFAEMLNLLPGWFFAGLTDGSGAGSIPNDTRLKGERLRDIAAVMNKKGFNIDIAEGELMWNGLLRGSKADKLANDQLDRLEKLNKNKSKNKSAEKQHLVTLYIPGTIPQTMHWSWNATYSNSVVRNWLFQQVNDKAYNPAK